MSAPVPLHPAAKPRDRSIAARRAARLCKVERERLIVDYLNRGVSVAEIAGRIGVTEKRIRALTKDILARRMPAAPEDFAALQVSRLNEALLIAYGAMSAENLRAVALVVRIVRELDRYHGFAAAGRRPRGEESHPLPQSAGEGGRRSRPDGVRPAASMLAGLPDQPGHPPPSQSCSPHPIRRASPDTFRGAAGEGEAPAAPHVHGPEMAPQPLEKMESAHGNGAARGASDHMLAARPGPQNDVGAEPSDEAVAPPAFPSSAHDAPPCDGSEMAPQAPEKVHSGPGNGGNPAAALPPEGASPCNDAFASCGDAPEQAPPPAGPIELPHEATARPEPPEDGPMGVSVAIDATGGVRRVKFRILPNGVAAC